MCVCGVKAETQCPQCIQGKWDAGRVAAPFLPEHFDVLFIRGGEASGVFNSTTAATAAEISAYVRVRVCVVLISLASNKRGNFCFRNNVLENVCPVIHFPQ